MKKFEFKMSNSFGTLVEYICFGDVDQFDGFYKEAIKFGSVVKGASIDQIKITDIDSKNEVK